MWSHFCMLLGWLVASEISMWSRQKQKHTISLWKNVLCNPSANQHTATAICSGHSRLAATCLDQCKLTEDSEAPCGSLGADKVADGTCVLPAVSPSGWVDDQKAPWEGDPGVCGDGGTSFAPLDCDLCPSSPRTLQRHISPLHRHWRDKQTHPVHCIYRESKKCFTKELQKQKYPEKVSKRHHYYRYSAWEYERELTSKVGVTEQ